MAIFDSKFGGFRNFQSGNTELGAILSSLEIKYGVSQQQPYIESSKDRFQLKKRFFIAQMAFSN